MEHEKKLRDTLKRLEGFGWKTVPLRGKSPDAIACNKDGQLIAIEILGNRKGYDQHSWTFKGKKGLYGKLGFDDVLIEQFEYDVIDKGLRPRLF